MKYINPIKISIRHLRRDWKGWEWYWSCVDGIGSSRHYGWYHTDKDGNGVWEDSTLISSEDNLSLGYDRKKAYQRIRRWIIKQYRVPEKEEGG